MHLRLHTSPHFAAAKTWIAGVLLEDLLGLSVEMVFQEQEAGYLIGLPNGKQIVLEDHFFKYCDEQNFLATARHPKTSATLPYPQSDQDNIIALYGDSTIKVEENNIHCGLDLWGSAFFMLSRWEEYGREKEGRFPAEEAFAVRHGFIHRPVVQEYAAFLKECLALLGLEVPYPRQTARLHLSCDVDHPRLWRKPSDRLRTLAGSVFRRLNPAELGYWLTGPIWKRRDPFDVFDDWMTLAEKKRIRWHFNFLAGRTAAPDCDYDLQEPFIKTLLQQIQERGHTIGFHPSRMAAGNSTQFEKELAALQQSSPAAITTGRQHYLHFKMPDTWRLWADAGMLWDSSMGYAEIPGFRCGMAQAFQVFDCEAQRVLPVKELPLIAMDVTMAHYQRVPPAQAFEQLLQLGHETKKHGGEMVVLWHNSSWNTYFWAPWQEVLLQYIRRW